MTDPSNKSYKGPTLEMELGLMSFERIDFQTGTFYQGDCFEVLATLPAGGVDMILNDPPYGTTACAWDSVLPLPDMWAAYWRVLKANGPAVMTAQQPFTAVLTVSDLRKYRYNWVWDKGYSTGFANANKMPMKGFEDVLIFYRSLPTYNPQDLVDTPPKVKKRVSGGAGAVMGSNGVEGKEYTSSKTNYPNGIISTKKERGFHPTQKPVALFEYLIKTYTNLGGLVLDPTAGSGTTAVAAIQAGRRWICIERDPEYFFKACARVYEAEAAA